MDLNNNNFVVVGAGPVGLWTAIQLNKRFPDSIITLYERYEVYKRKHILKIQHSSLFFGASLINDQNDNNFFLNVFDNKRKKIKNTPFAKSFISTSSIEQNLKQWVLNLGCKIVYKHIHSLDELISLHNENTTFILANGAHSNLRTELLGEEDINKTDLQHILELKTSVNKTKKVLKKVNANGSIKGKLNSLSFEYIGKTQDNNTPLNLRMFVNEKLYNEVPEATFKNPITNLNSLPQSIQSDIEEYAKLHNLTVEELFEKGQITKLQLSVYHAKKFAAEYKNRHFFLVGDTAMGVPYFRALNCGLVLGSRLSKILKISKNSSKAITMYNNYQHVHRNAEEFLAKSKNNMLNNYNQLRKLYLLIKK